MLKGLLGNSDSATLLSPEQKQAKSQDVAITINGQDEDNDDQVMSMILSGKVAEAVSSGLVGGDKQVGMFPAIPFFKFRVKLPRMPTNQAAVEEEAEQLPLTKKYMRELIMLAAFGGVTVVAIIVSFIAGHKIFNSVAAGVMLLWACVNFISIGVRGVKNLQKALQASIPKVVDVPVQKINKFEGFVYSLIDSMIQIVDKAAKQIEDVVGKGEAAKQVLNTLKNAKIEIPDASWLHNEMMKLRSELVTKVDKTKSMAVDLPNKFMSAYSSDLKCYIFFVAVPGVLVAGLSALVVFICYSINEKMLSNAVGAFVLPVAVFVVASILTLALHLTAYHPTRAIYIVNLLIFSLESTINSALGSNIQQPFDSIFKDQIGEIKKKVDMLETNLDKARKLLKGGGLMTGGFGF